MGTEKAYVGTGLSGNGPELGWAQVILCRPSALHPLCLEQPAVSRPRVQRICVILHVQGRQSVHLSIYPSTRLSVCLPIDRSVSIYLCLNLNILIGIKICVRARVCVFVRVSVGVLDELKIASCQCRAGAHTLHRKWKERVKWIDGHRMMRRTWADYKTFHRMMRC